MTILITKFTRELLNIDTIERSLTTSLLLLRNACISEGKSYKYYNAVKISTNIRSSGETYTANLIASAKIPYNSIPTLISGMNLGENLKELTTNTPVPSFLPITPTNNPPLMPIEPSSVNTLEKYLLWASQILASSLLPATDKVKISFLEEDPTEPSIYLELVLPINWQVYLLSGNLIQATKLLVTNYITTAIDGSDRDLSDSDFSNESTLGNLSVVKN